LKVEASLYALKIPQIFDPHKTHAVACFNSSLVRYSHGDEDDVDVHKKFI